MPLATARFITTGSTLRSASFDTPRNCSALGHDSLSSRVHSAFSCCCGVRCLSSNRTLHFVVVRPPVGLSTADVYSVCRPAANRKHIQPLSTAVSQGHGSQTGRLLFNRLQAAAESLSPWIDRLRRQFEREDVLGHAMSGSGTAYFGLCRHARHAKRIARRLEANGAGSVFAVRSCR